MIIHNMDQGSDEWFKVRAGKFTASNICKLFMGKSTGGYNNYLNDIVYERLTGDKEMTFQSNWMDRGVEMEAEALEAFELEYFQKVVPCGFIEASPTTGCSPDGLINDNGMIQVKCLKHTTMISGYLSGKIDRDYEIQMQSEMLFAEREYNIYFAYHPKLKPIHIVLKRDENIITSIKAEIETAEKEVKRRLLKIKDGK